MVLMSPEEFRVSAHQVVDWMADYLRDIRDFPVVPSVEPGETFDKLPAQAPERGESMETILADFRSLILPGITHWNHPRFHAYFSVSASGPGILGEMIAARTFHDQRVPIPADFGVLVTRNNVASHMMDLTRQFERRDAAPDRPSPAPAISSEGALPLISPK